MELIPSRPMKSTTLSLLLGSTWWWHTQMLSPAVLATTKRRHQQGVDEAKDQKESAWETGEKNSDDICERSDPALPVTTYSPFFSVHESINLFPVGFLSLEMEGALANIESWQRNVVKKRPQKIQPKGRQNRKKKRKQWIQQTAKQSKKRTRLRVRAPGFMFQLCHLPMTLVSCDPGWQHNISI